MPKKQKKNNLTSIFDKRPESLSLYDAYQQVNAFSDVPLSQAMVKKLELSILDWCQLDTSRSFEQFLDERGIHERTWEVWRNKYPELRDAHEYAIRHIGIVRENGMADRKFDSKTYGFVQHHYSKIWKATREEEWAKKRELANATPGVTHINVIDTLAESLKEVPKIYQTKPQQIAPKDVESKSAEQPQDPLPVRSLESEFDSEPFKPEDIGDDNA